MLVNHPQCCSAAALMNTGPQTELSVCRYSPITLENRIQLPATLSLPKKKTPRSPLDPSRPPDHISCSLVMPLAANLSQDLTFCDLPSSRTPTPAGPVTCITCCSFSQSDQLRFILWLRIGSRDHEPPCCSKMPSRHVTDCCLLFMKSQLLMLEC